MVVSDSADPLNDWLIHGSLSMPSNSVTCWSGSVPDMTCMSEVCAGTAPSERASPLCALRCPHHAWSSPDHAPAVVRKKVEKKTHQEDLTGAISMSATDQLQLTDYVLKYYDEDDFEETTSRK